MSHKFRRLLLVSLGATVLLMTNLAATPAFAASTAVQISIPSVADVKSSMELWIELAKALAWPLAVALLALFFRVPLIDFAAAIGGRVSKLQISEISIELTTARAPAQMPLLDEIRDHARVAEIADSAGKLLEQVQSTDPADYALIHLGDGREWLTSRLFIAAALMSRMRGIKAFVFLETNADTERRFLATVDVQRLRWILATRYPWLEVAYALAYGEANKHRDPKYDFEPIITSDTGALFALSAQSILQKFIYAIQLSSSAGFEGDVDWVRLRGSKERAAFVTRRLLTGLLAARDFETSLVARSDLSPARLSRAMLRINAPFVALVNERGEFLRLVNRRAYLEIFAAQAGQEPD